MIYTKITRLHLNVSRQHLATIKVTCCKMKDSANLRPSLSPIYAIKRIKSSTTAIYICTWNSDCISPTSIVFCRSINCHGWKATSGSTLVNEHLRKTILRKISLSWWTTQSLVSLLYVYLFFYVLIYWFIHCR